MQRNSTSYSDNAIGFPPPPAATTTTTPINYNKVDECTAPTLNHNTQDVVIVNILMLTDAIRVLRADNHHAWVCSSGSKGYCATKEMLQSGIPGHTLLIESGDLRVVQEDSSEGQCCCLVYNQVLEDGRLERIDFKKQISPAVRNLRVYGNVTCTPTYFLAWCIGLKSIDLSPLSQVTVIQGHFLSGCVGLTSIDLSPFCKVTEVYESFLAECTSLASLDLSPLSQVTEVGEGFLHGCTGLSSLDISPLSLLEEITGGFLTGCTGLTSLDLSPLSRVKKVQYAFLGGCTGLTTIDLRPLSQVVSVGWGFLQTCRGLTALDVSPLSQVKVLEGRFISGCSSLTNLDLGSLSQVTLIVEEFEAFLHGCIGINSVDNPPPACAIPREWLQASNTLWVRK